MRRPNRPAGPPGGARGELEGEGAAAEAGAGAPKAPAAAPPAAAAAAPPPSSEGGGAGLSSQPKGAEPGRRPLSPPVPPASLWLRRRNRSVSGTNRARRRRRLLRAAAAVAAAALALALLALAALAFVALAASRGAKEGGGGGVSETPKPSLFTSVRAGATGGEGGHSKVRGGSSGAGSRSGSGAPPPSSAAAAIAVVPLLYASGTLHARAALGAAASASASSSSPPRQEQLWIVDTGSRLSSTSCTRSSLSRSAALPAHFDPSKSPTLRVHRCGSCRLQPLSAANRPGECRRRRRLQQRERQGQLLRQERPRGGGGDGEGFGGGDDDLEWHLPSGPQAGGGRRRPEQRGGPPPPPCRVSQKYTEGSRWTAYEVSDAVELLTEEEGGGNREDGLPPPGGWGGEGATAAASGLAVPFAFGCQTASTGMFREQPANGILGLERSEHSYVSLLHGRGRIPRDAFSICLDPAAAAEKGEPPSRGWLGLGGSVLDAASPRGGRSAPRQRRRHRYTPIVRPESNGLYRVEVVQVWLGDECLLNRTSAAAAAAREGRARSPEGAAALLRGTKGGGGGEAPGGMAAVVDSGTTDTFLPAHLARAWGASWLRQTGRPWAGGARAEPYAPGVLASLPDVTLCLAASSPRDGGSAGGVCTAAGSFPWTVPPAHYMEAAAGEAAAGRDGAAPEAGESSLVSGGTARREYTVRIYVNEPGTGAVLGLNAQRGHDVLYDAENRRVGLAPVQSCVGDSSDEKG